MNGNRGLTRRRFLLLSPAFGAALVSKRVMPGIWPDPSSPAEKLVGLLRHRSSARVLGAAYLRMMPSEARIGVLVDAITTDLDSAPFRLTEDQLRKFVMRRVERDFEGDAIVCLEGWVLSRTEARLYGLAALVPSW